jgi:hypothetical protein
MYILHRSSIERLSILYQAPSSDMVFPISRMAFIEDDLIVNMPPLLVEEMIEFKQVDKLYEAGIAIASTCRSEA